jgi:hypothetical protein
MDAVPIESQSSDFVLMLRGETRHCADCDTATVFLPVGEFGWACTSCDAAVVLVDPAHAWVSAA